MFSCRYDGYDEDSSSSSVASANEGASFDEADKFEELMNVELKADVQEISDRQGILKTGQKEKETEKLAEIESNDNLLYDPNEDEENAEWMKELQNSNHGCDDNKHTDAILNCPGCMTLLSVNCQRHSKYKTQYRTLFTFNCTVDESEILHLPSDTENLVSAVQEKARPHRVEDSDAIFYRVICEVCNSPVGLRDSKGVFHLFGVLASHS